MMPLSFLKWIFNVARPTAAVGRQARTQGFASRTAKNVLFILLRARDGLLATDPEHFPMA
jgi:hypothetical protein